MQNMVRYVWVSTLFAVRGSTPLWAQATAHISDIAMHPWRPA
jgi:hypothetical protein